jgi:hypothetical protein
MEAGRDQGTSEVVMIAAKEEVRRLLDALPDDASFEDIQYHIYVRDKIERGLDAVKNGQATSQADAGERLSHWLDE